MVTALLVKELREHTGAGMMECKKALEETKGDLEAAITLMRKSGQAKAAKKVNRIAAEGVVVIKVSSDNKTAIMLEVNCETDFVSRDKSFLEFADTIATQGLKNKVTDHEQLLAMVLDNGQTTLAMCEALIAKIGENINLRRVKLVTITADGMVGSYVHSNSRIGVLVGLSVANSELGKDIAMHIAACKPAALLPEEIPAALIDKEKEIYLSQLQDTKKPPEILEKILSGRIQKFIGEVTLLKQPFIKNPDITIEGLLQQLHAQIFNFSRFEVGEGIDKKETDFAAEVQAQVNSKK